MISGIAIAAKAIKPQIKGIVKHLQGIFMKFPKQICYYTHAKITRNKINMPFITSLNCKN